MTAELWVALAIAVVGVPSGLYAAWRGGKAAEHTPYDALAKRVVALEDADRDNKERILRLEHQLSRFVLFIREYLVWVEDGAVPPPPVPSEELAAFVASWPDGMYRHK